MYSKFIFIIVAQKLDPIKCSFIQQTICLQALLVFPCKCIINIYKRIFLLFISVILRIVVRVIYKYFFFREHKSQNLSRLGLCPNDEDDMNVQGKFIFISLMIVYYYHPQRFRRCEFNLLNVLYVSIYCILSQIFCEFRHYSFVQTLLTSNTVLSVRLLI